MIPKEYAFSKFSKIFIVIVLSFPLVMFSTFLGRTLPQALITGPAQGRNLIVAGILLLVVAGFLFWVLQVLFYKVLIKEDSISTRTLFRSKELLFSQIKGYRLADHYVIIESTAKDRKNININLSINDIREINDWLENNYPNLDDVEKDDGYERILNDPRYGRDREERKARYENASGPSKLINALGVIILLLGLIWRIEKFVVVIAIAAPIVFLIVLRVYKGLIRVTYSKRSPVHSIFFGLLAILIFLLFKAVRYSVLDLSALWQRPEVLISIGLVALLTLGNKTYRHLTRSRMVELIVFTLCSFCYGLCSVLIINCCFDTRENDRYTARVLDKWIETSKASNVYRLQISGWKEMREGQRISVSRTEFERINIADQINIYLYRGRLSIPWYIITDR